MTITCDAEDVWNAAIEYRVAADERRTVVTAKDISTLCSAIHHLSDVIMTFGGEDDGDRDRLILEAAAPDLLAALESLMSNLQHENSRCPFGLRYTPNPIPGKSACDCNYHAAYHEARAVIAKARGN